MNSSHNTEEHNDRNLHRFIVLFDSFLLNSSNG